MCVCENRIVLIYEAKFKKIEQCKRKHSKVSPMYVQMPFGRCKFILRKYCLLTYGLDTFWSHTHAFILNKFTYLVKRYLAFPWVIFYFFLSDLTRSSRAFLRKRFVESSVHLCCDVASLILRPAYYKEQIPRSWERAMSRYTRCCGWSLKKILGACERKDSVGWWGGKTGGREKT